MSITPAHLDQLARWYTTDTLQLFERAGERYPLAVRQMNGAPDDVLATRLPDRPIDRSELVVYDSSILDAAKARGQRLYNGTTFAFDGLRDGRLHARLGTYFDFQATSIALEREFLRGETTMRDQLHKVVSPSDVFDSGAGRSAALGAGVTLIYKTADGYRAMIAQRSPQMAHYAGAYHVLPAFMFQPAGATPQPHEWSIAAQTRREYAEELLGAEEMETGGTNEDASQAYHLQSMIDNGAAEMHLLGLSLNLMSLHVAVLVLLIIHDEAWIDGLPAPTWETQRLYSMAFDTDTDVYDALGDDLPSRFAPTGAAAMWLGIDRAREVLG